MRLLLLLLAVGSLAVGVEAQPRADAVVAAWLDGWNRAERSAERVVMTERTEHTVQGPRGGRTVEVVADVTYRFGERPEREVLRVMVEGREADRRRGPDNGRRLRRTFGRAGRFATQPPPLPGRLLGAADASDLRSVQLDGVDAWRVSLDFDRTVSTAWFTRSERAPRLIAIRTELDGGSVWRETRYQRVGGLDVPSSLRASATVRQRRRLRDYVVTLSVTSAYSGHSIR